MAGTFTPQLDILPAAQRRLWHELTALPDQFTLYGGTAIALRLGHRQSIDFDFFGDETFDPQRLMAGLDFLQGAEVSQLEANTLTCILDRDGPVQVSFFGVPRLRKLAEPDIAEGHGMKVASLLDLAGTKVSVLQKRAAARDYIDLDVLISNGIPLDRALAAGAALYGANFNPQVTLKALTFYEDGDLEDVPLETRARLRTAVRAVDMKALPDLGGRS